VALCGVRMTKTNIKVTKSGTKQNKGQRNLAQCGITDRCCHLVNHKPFLSVSQKQLHVLAGGLMPKPPLRLAQEPPCETMCR